jgi:hypothetical protein
VWLFGARKPVVNCGISSARGPIHAGDLFGGGGIVAYNDAGDLSAAGGIVAQNHDFSFRASRERGCRMVHG